MPKRTWNETRNKVPSRDASYSFHPMADCTVVEVAALTLYTAPSVTRNRKVVSGLGQYRRSDRTHTRLHPRHKATQDASEIGQAQIQAAKPHRDHVWQA